MRFKLSLVLVLLVLLAVTVSAGNGQILRAPGTSKIENQYIVVFRPGAQAAPVAQQLAQFHGGDLVRLYQHALLGAVFRMPEQAARALARDPSVAYV